MINRSTITIDTKTAEGIFSEIELIEKRLSALRKKVLQYLRPAPYGSEAWWEKQEVQADKEIKEGKYTVYENAKDLIADLHAGK